MGFRSAEIIISSVILIVSSFAMLSTPNLGGLYLISVGLAVFSASFLFQKTFRKWKQTPAKSNVIRKSPPHLDPTDLAGPNETASAQGNRPVESQPSNELFDSALSGGEIQLSAGIDFLEQAPEASIAEVEGFKGSQEPHSRVALYEISPFEFILKEALTTNQSQLQRLDELYIRIPKTFKKALIVCNSIKAEAGESLIAYLSAGRVLDDQICRDIYSQTDLIPHFGDLRNLTKELEEPFSNLLSQWLQTYDRIVFYFDDLDLAQVELFVRRCYEINKTANSSRQLFQGASSFEINESHLVNPPTPSSLDFETRV